MFISLCSVCSQVHCFSHSSLLLFFLYRAFNSCSEVILATLVILADHWIFLWLLVLWCLRNVETEIFSCELYELFFSQQEGKQKFFLKGSFEASIEVSRWLEASRKQYLKHWRHIETLFVYLIEVLRLLLKDVTHNVYDYS